MVVFFLTLIQPNFVDSLLKQHSKRACRTVLCACENDNNNRVTTTTASTTSHPTTITAATRLHSFATVTAAVAAISAITLAPAMPAQADDDDNSLFIDNENKFALVIPPSWQTGYARKQSSSTNLMAKYLPEEVTLSCNLITSESVYNCISSNQPFLLQSSHRHCYHISRIAPLMHISYSVAPSLCLLWSPYCHSRVQISLTVLHCSAFPLLVLLLPLPAPGDFLSP